MASLCGVEIPEPDACNGNWNLQLQDPSESHDSDHLPDQQCRDELAREYRGNYECEIIFEGGDDDDKLETLYSQCEKNPGHPSFIRVPDFKMEHLPKAFRKEKIMRSVLYWIDLTVKISLRYVSKNRPDTFPDSKKPYPYSRIRGSNRLRRFGTGNIFGVALEEDAVQEEVCPCHLCEKLEFEHREKEFWTVLIETSKHVIFDSSEAKWAVIECFYDSDSNRSETVKFLYGYAMNEKKSKINEDLCQVKCVTHDKELVEKLRRMVKQNDYCIIPQYKKFLGILISHPHGCSKKITVGRVHHLIVPVGWDYPTEIPIPCDDTMTCQLPLYPWSKNDNSKTLALSSQNDSPGVSSSSSHSSDVITAPSSNMSQASPSVDANNSNSQQQQNNSSTPVENVGAPPEAHSTITSCEPWNEDPSEFAPIPGTEFLLPLGTKFTLPKKAEYALKFQRLNSTYFNFPPGTRFTLSNGTSVFFPPEAEFSLYMLSARVSYVSYTVDSCPGSSGAGLLLDGGHNVVCCTFPHSGKDEITPDANRSGLQCYTILPRSAVSTTGKDCNNGNGNSNGPSTPSTAMPVIMPQYIRFQLLDE